MYLRSISALAVITALGACGGSSDGRGGPEVLQQGDGGPAQPPEYHTPAGHPRCWEYNGTYPSPRMIPLPTMSAIHLVWVPFEISIAILFP